MQAGVETEPSFEASQVSRNLSSQHDGNLTRAGVLGGLGRKTAPSPSRLAARSTDNRNRPANGDRYLAKSVPSDRSTGPRVGIGSPCECLCCPRHLGVKGFVRLGVASDT